MTAEKNKNVIKSALDATLDKVTAVTNFALFVILVAMGLVLGANIAMRFLFESPISWSNVVSRYAYIYIVLLGTAISYIEGSHAKIDFVYTAAPKKLKVFFDLCHYLVMMFLCVILIIYGIKHVITMWPVHSPVVPSLSIGFVYLSVPICAAIMILFLAQKILEIKFQTEVAP